MMDDGGEAGGGGSTANTCCATSELACCGGNCPVGAARRGVGSAEGEKSRRCSGLVEDKSLEALGSRIAELY